MSPVLAQFNKCGSIQTHNGQLTLRIKDEERIADTVTARSINDVGLPQNLARQDAKTVETPSVNRIVFKFVEPMCGVQTSVLAAISSFPETLDIIVDQHGVSVLTITKNDFASGLYNTIKQWKQAPHLRKLKSRPFFRSMKPLAARRKRRPGSRHSQL